MVQCYANAKEVESVINTLEVMKNLKIFPSLKTFLAVAPLFEANGDRPRILEMAKLMADNGIKFYETEIEKIKSCFASQSFGERMITHLQEIGFIDAGYVL